MSNRRLGLEVAGLARAQRNVTGMPDHVKAELEARAHTPLDDVRVRYASPEPARYGALAFARGTEVFLGPSQERHLSHEIAHVIQQKQGRVRADATVGGAALNSASHLEREAERFAEGHATSLPLSSPAGPFASGQGTIQRVLDKSGKELELDDLPEVDLKALRESVGQYKSAYLTEDTLIGNYVLTNEEFLALRKVPDEAVSSSSAPTRPTPAASAVVVQKGPKKVHFHLWLMHLRNLDATGNITWTWGNPAELKRFKGKVSTVELHADVAVAAALGGGGPFRFYIHYHPHLETKDKGWNCNAKPDRSGGSHVPVDGKLSGEPKWLHDHLVAQKLDYNTVKKSFDA